MRVRLPDGRTIYRLLRCTGANYPQQEAPEPGKGILQPSCLTVDATDISESADTADPKISAKKELEVINLSSDPNVHRPISISAS